MFTPYGDGNDTCSGIQQYEALRPDPPAYLFDISLVTYSIMVFLHVSLLPIMWKWRNKSRFYKIRPFFLTWFFQFFLIIYMTTYLLPVLTNDYIPCWVLIIGMTISLTFMLSILALRIMTLGIETLYMQSAHLHLVKLQQQNNEETETIGSHTTSHWHMMRILVSIFMGYYSAERYLPKDLLYIKHSNVFISIILYQASDG